MRPLATISLYCFSLAWLLGAAPPPAGGFAKQVVALHDANTVQAEFRIGTGGKLGLGFKFADQKTLLLSGVVKADEMKRTVEKDGKKIQVPTPMADALIEFRGAGLMFQNHVRPCLQRYTEAQREDLVKQWEEMPSASQHWTRLEVRALPSGAELWMEGKFCGLLAGEGKLQEVSFEAQGEGAVRGTKTLISMDHGLFLPLDIRNVARPGAMKDATLSLQTGLQQVHAIPMIIGDGAGNADVGVVKEMQGQRALETNENTSRTSLDGMQESLHFSVPQAYYHRAWVLCAVEDDKKKDPVLTTRLTRFAVSGRGGAIADTTLTLPRGNEKASEGMEIVGSVSYPVQGTNITSPLYLVPVELKAGDILDTLGEDKDAFEAMKVGRYLDFEFLGKMGGIEVQSDRRRKPLATSVSGVHVFGVTLERAPVELRLVQSQPGNIFHNDETPETKFALHAITAGIYTLRWEIRDVTGTCLQTQDKTVAMQVGENAEVTAPLAMPQLGWYGLHVQLSDAHEVLYRHEAAFALLGRDTRTAGYESPFGTWWFGGAHYSTRDINVAGPLMFKAGLRRTVVGWTKDTEADLAPWKLVHNQIGWPFRLADLDNWPAAEARAEKTIGDMLTRFPDCHYIDLFHESYDPGAYPPELFGDKYEAKDEKTARQEDRLFELGVKAAKFMRAKFPQLKIIMGNSGGSSGIVAAMLRRHFPRELFDYLGSETTGQSIAPEKLSPHTTAGIWLMGETARKLGYDDVPLTGCFEFTSRAERDLGPQRLAEWYAKDMLYGLAYRFPTISPAGIEDVCNAYYDTLWGAAGLCERRPLHYPKPAYVALATLTKVLDSASLVRQMDTGSSSAYALEFARGHEHIYALWTPRGQCEITFEFQNQAPVRTVSFYGQSTESKTAGQRFTATASSAVSYVITSLPAIQVKAGSRQFDPPPAGTQTVNPMEDLAQWQLDPANQPITTTTRRPGRFELRQINDNEKGPCLELELQHDGTTPSVVGEYTALRLKNPAPIPATAHSVGLWVKGDSSWGRIFWEITDAKGERWRSSGGYDGGDWGNASFIDFDGWRFVTFPLTKDSPFKHIEPGSGPGQWQHEGGDGKLDYPLQLTGLFIETHRESLNLTKMTPVTKNIRLKEVSVISSQ